MALKLKTKYRINENVEINEADHKLLLKYIIERLDYAKTIRDSKVSRYEAIDKELAGFLKLSSEDKQRQKDTIQGLGPKPFTTNLQMTRVQLDEALTVILSLFFPQEGPYKSRTKKEKQPIADGLSVLMNRSATAFGHFRCANRSIFDAFKYNEGYFETGWESLWGNTISSDEASTQVKVTENVEIFKGNTLRYCDPYNLLVDPIVDIVDLPTQGEFFAMPELVSEFALKRMEQNGLLFNVDKALQSGDEVYKYYVEKPDIVGEAIVGSQGSQVNWVSLLSAGNMSESSSIPMQESVRVVMWLPAKQFRLSDSTKFELWEFKILAGSVIGFGKKLPVTHGLLPITGMRPWDDNFGGQTQSYAEILLPFQRFASFQMNMHQEAARKSVYGITFYNEQAIPAFKNHTGVAGKIPFSGNYENMDINKIVKQIFDAPNTDNTLRDIQSMADIMQGILPTNKVQSMAGLDRATKYQAAAVSQEHDKRHLKMAALIDIQAFSKSRTMQVLNIKAQQETMEVVTPEGAITKVDPKQIRDLDFMFDVENGLFGIDKLIVSEQMKEIMYAILQMPQAAQTIDVVAMLNYVTTLFGDHTDINQFKIKSEFDKLTPEQKQMAYTLLTKTMEAQNAEQSVE